MVTRNVADFGGLGVAIIGHSARNPPLRVGRDSGPRGCAAVMGTNIPVVARHIA